MSSKEELIAEAEKRGVDIDKRWGVDRIERALGIDAGEIVEQHEETADERIVYMNSRVLAVWDGQSSSLPVHERKRRIIKAMEDKGFGDILEAIEWPA